MRVTRIYWTKILIVCNLAFIVIFLYMVKSHLRVLVLTDIDAEGIFEDRFVTYVTTMDCSRNSHKIVKYIPNAIFINDTSCEALESKLPKDHRVKFLSNPLVGQVSPGNEQYTSQEVTFKDKYKEVVKACKSSGKMMCLILEDDVTWIFDREKTLHSLVTNTLSYDSNDLASWDCSKWGIGQLQTRPTGNKGQCRIISQERIDCLLDYFDILQGPSDLVLKTAIMRCNLQMGKFMLVQHSGGKSLFGARQAPGESSRVKKPKHT